MTEYIAAARGDPILIAEAYIERCRLEEKTRELERINRSLLDQIKQIEKAREYWKSKRGHA